MTFASVAIGRRCIELDCFDGQPDPDTGAEAEPQITHKHTWIAPISVRDVLKAIHTYGFRASPYPIILSLEMHCGLEQQSKIARNLVEIFGHDNQIYVPPGDDNAAAMIQLKSPEELKYKVIIKGKRVTNDSSGCR